MSGRCRAALVCLSALLALSPVFAALAAPQAAQAAVTREAARAAALRMAAGEAFSVAIGPSGSVSAWGANDWGQRGVPPEAAGALAVSAGSAHALALLGDGTVVEWGGIGFTPPQRVPGVTGVIAVAAGGLHSLALRSDGTVVAWGDNTFNQTRVPAGLTGVVAVSAGGTHSVALRSDGTVVAWGDNSSGQTSVPGDLRDVVAISAGGVHTLALRADGTVRAWGGNTWNQSSVPQALREAPASPTQAVVAVAAGGGHSLALLASGAVRGWGRNHHEQAFLLPPRALPSDAVGIAAGAAHSLMRRADGTVVGWGLNADGQALAPVAFAPREGATGIPLHTSFAITYASPVTPGARYGEISLHDHNLNSVAVTVAIAGNVLTVTPQAPLAVNARYTLRIPGGAVVNSLGIGTVGSTADFATPDTVSPSLVAKQPADAASGVFPERLIVLSFSEGVFPGPAFSQIAIHTAGGAQVPYTTYFAGGVLVLIPPQPLDPREAHTLTVPRGAVVDAAGNPLDTAHTSAFTTGVRVARVAGADRVLTAIEVSRSAFATSSAVVIATSRNFPDALAAAPLAHALRAPILLVPGNTLPAEVAREIERLGATRAVIVGGTGAVAAGVADALARAHLTVTRIAGKNRYDTAAQIATALAQARGVSGFGAAYVVTGENFPDALAAGGVAAARGVPILLTKRDVLPSQTAAALQTLNVTSTVVLGGRGVVADAVAAELPAFTRIAGENRFETAVKVAEHALAGTPAFTLDTVYLATGRNFPDALAAGPVIAARGNPLILVPDTVPVPAAVSGFFTARTGVVDDLIVLGGSSVVPDAVITELRVAAH